VHNHLEKLKNYCKDSSSGRESTFSEDLSIQAIKLLSNNSKGVIDFANRESEINKGGEIYSKLFDIQLYLKSNMLVQVAEVQLL